jgi:hypothetical protein
MRFRLPAKARHSLLPPRSPHGRGCSSRSTAAPVVQHLAFVPSPHNVHTAIDKSNIPGDVACAVAHQKGRHRADVGDERRLVER